MDKEVVVYTYNGLLVSHKRKEFESVLGEVDEPRVCHTEWSKLEREKQISYVNTYIWNLEKWYWWTYLQESNGDTDIEDRLVDTMREEEGGANWERNVET